MRPPPRPPTGTPRPAPELTARRRNPILSPVETLPADIDDQRPSAHVIRVPSKLSHESAEALRRTAEQRFAHHDVEILVLDLALVEVVTSIGVTSLLEIKQLADDNEATLVLAGLPERHRDFFQLLRVDQLFQFAPSVESAIEESG